MQILQNNLPLSDDWLIQGPLAEVLLPWTPPGDGAELRRGEDGAWRLLDDDRLYILGPDEVWAEVWQLSDGRVRSRSEMEWDTEALPRRMRTTHRRHHYRSVRERASVE